MKRSLVIAIAGPLIAASGCSRKDQPAAGAATNAPEASGNPLTAPVDYLGAVAKAKKTAEKTVDAASLNKAVQLFSATEGRYPKDLNELVTTKYLTSIPDPPYGMKIVYDAATGEVKIVPK